MSRHDAPLSLTRAALVLASCALALATGACGARTGLRVPDGGITARDGGPDARPPCSGDGDCDDHVGCTHDRCASGACVHETDDSRCDDHRYCDGVETCALDGCRPGPPPCADGIDCTDDVCNEDRRTCRYDPNSSLCPLSNVCDATTGCEPAVYAIDDGRLYAIELSSGTLVTVAPTESTLTDVALAADGSFYGATHSGLVSLDPRTGAVRLLFPVRGDFVALEVDPMTNVVYGGTLDELVRFDVAAGALTTVGRLPFGVIASGDIAFRGRLLYITTTSDRGGGAADDLYTLALDTGVVSRVGSVGVPCMWALAAYHDTLYGLTCRGEVYTLDPTTAAATLVATDMVGFNGAAAR